jgi:hypothetical protein
MEARPGADGFDGEIYRSFIELYRYLAVSILDPVIVNGIVQDLREGRRNTRTGDQGKKSN